MNALPRCGCGRVLLTKRSCVDTASWGGSAGCGRRCPAAAQTVAVFASLRLRCDARPEVASQNSLCSLRSRRSDNRDESVYEARFARRPQACASRRHRQRRRRAPPAATFTAVGMHGAPLLVAMARSRCFCGASSFFAKTRPGSVCGVPLFVAMARPGCFRGTPPLCPQRRVPVGCGAPLRGAEERRACGRARSALRELACRSCPNGESEANKVSSATGHVIEHRREVAQRPPH
jgi:hypothetical protein